MARWFDWLGLAVCLMLGAVFVVDYMTSPKQVGPKPQFTAYQRRRLKRFGLMPLVEKKAAEE